MRRETPPADGPSQAKLIQPSRVVFIDAAREDLFFPGVGGNLEALQLMQNLQQATLAAQLGLRRDVLPAQQPAHKLCRGDRFDLLAKRGDGEVMYAREQAALAPLDGVAHDSGR